MSGVERRRRWSTEDKLEIVAESLAEGAVVSDVARRHGIAPEQLFGWRAKVRAELAAAKAAEPEGPQFVPAVVARVAASAPDARATPATMEPGRIEIVIGGASVRVEGRVDAQAWLTDTLEKLVAAWPASRIDDLMPWAYAKTAA